MLIIEFGDIANLVRFSSEQNISYPEANIKTVKQQLNRKATLVLHLFKRVFHSRIFAVDSWSETSLSGLLLCVGLYGRLRSYTRWRTN